LEKVAIEILPEVIDFLNDVVKILFKKEYFGFQDAAQRYVQKIYDFIEFELVNFPHKSTPSSLKIFGSNYVFYKPNNRTTWYIFFEKKQNRILITHITNNHIKELNEL
jgi:plasmid stabilization system protein ParE